MDIRASRRFSFLFVSFLSLSVLLTGNLAAEVDENNNGIDDVWEVFYSAIGIAPNGDPDRDTKTNLDESRAGTDPFLADDFLRISKFVKDGSNATVTFKTQLGKVYKVYQTPNLTQPLWTQVGSDVAGTGGVINFPVSGLTGSTGYFRISVDDVDTDSDGLSDWAENLLDGFDPGSDFSTDPEVSDRDAFIVLFAAAGGPSIIDLTVVQGEAFEVFGDSGPAQEGLLRISRASGISPLTVFFTKSGSAGAADFSLKDAGGADVGDFVQLGFGKSQLDLRIVPVVDTIADYPRDVSLTLDVHPDYDTGASTSGKVDIFDANDIPENVQLFYGQITPERNAATTSSGYATLRLNGKRTRGIVDFRFSGLSANQTASHIHQSNDDGGGNIINGPIVESLPIGVIDDYIWDISATGPFTGQDLIDSLYGQNGNLPLYTNAHTANYPGGEIWAFFTAYEGGDFTPPEDPPPLNDETGDPLKKDIARFLTQATFGPRKADIDALYDSVVNDHGGDRIAAYDEWLDAQLVQGRTKLYDLTFAMDQEEWAMNGNLPINNTNPQPFHNNRRAAWWSMAVAGKDQLRQRVAQALSEICVISDDHATVRSRHYGAAKFYDQLAANTNDTYLDVLLDVSRSPMMGKYLSHLQNRKAVFSGNEQITSPDENYAREIMQLFSIGLVQLNPDGSLKLDDNGEPVPTYGNDDITELARVFTGWSFSKSVGSKASGYPVQNNNSFTHYGGPNYFSASWENPMKNFASEHDNGAKTLLGEPIAAGLNGEQDLQAAVSILYNHDNIAPFICRRLIQRMVTSNPSSAYIYRVSQAFENAGTRGDLKAVVKAILLDYEARELSLTNDIGYGKQKEPLLRYIQMLRAGEGKSQLLLSDLTAHGFLAAQVSRFESGATQYRYYDTTALLGQSPMSAPSVFNWFLPDYVLGGPLAENGLFVPEFTITSESQVVQAININHSTIMAGTGMYGRPRYGETNSNPEHRILLDFAGISTRLGQLRDASSGADDDAKELDAITQILDEYDLVLCSGSMKERYENAAEPNPRSSIIEEMSLLWYSTDDATSSNDRLQICRDMIYLIAASPDFLIQR